MSGHARRLSESPKVAFIGEAHRSDSPWTALGHCSRRKRRKIQSLNARFDQMVETINGVSRPPPISMRRSRALSTGSSSTSGYEYDWPQTPKEACHERNVGDAFTLIKLAAYSHTNRQTPVPRGSILEASPRRKTHSLPDWLHNTIQTLPPQHPLKSKIAKLAIKEESQIAVSDFGDDQDPDQPIFAFSPPGIKFTETQPWLPLALNPDSVLSPRTTLNLTQQAPAFDAKPDTHNRFAIPEQAAAIPNLSFVPFKTPGSNAPTHLQTRPSSADLSELSGFLPYSAPGPNTKPIHVTDSLRVHQAPYVEEDDFLETNLPERSSKSLLLSGETESELLKVDIDAAIVPSSRPTSEGYAPTSALGTMSADDLQTLDFCWKPFFRQAQQDRGDPDIGEERRSDVNSEFMENSASSDSSPSFRFYPFPATIRSIRNRRRSLQQDKQLQSAFTPTPDIFLSPLDSSEMSEGSRPLSSE